MFEKLGLEKIQYDVTEFHLAFIHKSFDNKHNNERLEFLGDAILETAERDLHVQDGIVPRLLLLLLLCILGLVRCSCMEAFFGKLENGSLL